MYIVLWKNGLSRTKLPCFVLSIKTFIQERAEKAAIFITGLEYAASQSSSESTYTETSLSVLATFALVTVPIHLGSFCIARRSVNYSR